MYYKLYNELNTTRSVIGCCLWSIRVQVHGWRHRKIAFFVLSNMAPIFKMLARLFRIEQVKASKNVS